MLDTLSKDELLNIEGRIGIIESQSKCINQCYGCGADAPLHGDTMTAKVAKNVASAIAKIQKEHDIDLFWQDPKRWVTPISLFRRGDPGNYQSGKFGFWELANEFFNTNGKQTFMSTAGWNPKSKIKQQSMDNIVNDMQQKDSIVAHIGYSLKPFGKILCNEYEKFITSLLGGMPYNKKKTFLSKNHLNDVDRKLPRFFKDSRYVEMVAKNMETLKGAYPIVERQYLHEVGKVNGLPDKVMQFAYLFSREFLDKLADYLNIDSVDSRYFGDFGRAGNDLGIEESSTMRHMRSAKKNGSNPNKAVYLGNDIYFLVIDPKGIAYTLVGQPRALRSMVVDDKFLEARQNYSKHFYEKNMFKTLRKINGKRIY